MTYFAHNQPRHFASTITFTSRDPQTTIFCDDNCNKFASCCHHNTRLKHVSPSHQCRQDPVIFINMHQRPSCALPTSCRFQYSSPAFSPQKRALFCVTCKSRWLLCYYCQGQSSSIFTAKMLTLYPCEELPIFVHGCRVEAPACNRHPTFDSPHLVLVVIKVKSRFFELNHVTEYAEVRRASEHAAASIRGGK